MKQLQQRNTARTRSWALCAALFSTVTVSQANAQNICVFDIGGSNGDNFLLMRDYVLAAKKWNAEIVLKAYKNEVQAVADFKDNKCQGLVATGFATRQFNGYTGSIGAVGAVPSNAVARNVLVLMGNPKVAADMVEGDYEAAGIIPIGSAFFVNRDKNTNTLAKVEGKTLGVLPVDPTQRRMANKVGGKPVDISYDTAGAMFASGKLDVLPAPAMAFAPFELYRSMGDQGGIARFPVAFIASNLIINKSEFPNGFGQSSRNWFAAQAPRLMSNITRAESAVPAKFWFDISAEEQVGYLRLMRQMRMEYVQNKYYNPKMMSLLKKLRCQQDPSSFECALKGE